MNTQSKIIVALDGINREQALSLAMKLRDVTWGVKVNDLLLQYGVSIVEELRKHSRVFADPKLHDIPNTVKNGVSRLVSAGAELITIHASGGEEMIRSAVSAAGGAKILTVTALTSLAVHDTQTIFQRTPGETVLNLAGLASKAGAHGIVCSPLELELLASSPELNSLLRVVPGIRPSWHQKGDDQVRTSTPEGAVDAGASLLVIGRPVTEANDPVEAATRINAALFGQSQA